MREMEKYSPVIIGQKGPLDGMNWNVSGTMTIGRVSDCDIVINDRQVSRIHAKIIVNSQNQIFISDLESKNGTFINGELIECPTILKNGDEIKVALIQEFLFVSSDATMPLDQRNQVEASASRKLFIEQKARRVWLGEREIAPPLSVSQYNLLNFLYENENNVVTREQIVNAVWSEAESIGVTEQAIDALVRRLRSRLIKLDPSHEYVVTVRGVGYILKNKQL